MIAVCFFQLQDEESERKVGKNVHTSYSFIASTNLQKNKCIGNRSKSQANVIKDRSVSQEEIKEWFKELNKERKIKAWAQRLKRVAESLKNPEGEDKLRIKLRRYLEKTPSEFSDCDEEGRQFRKQLPDSIIKKLKKIYLVDEKRSTKVFRVEVTKNPSRDDVRLLISDWLNLLQLNKAEYVEKESIVNALALIIDSNIDAIKAKSDYKLLKRSVIKIVNDLPLDVSIDIKHTYVHKMASELIKSLVKIKDRDYFKKHSMKSRINCDFVEKSSCNSGDDVARPTPKDVKHFVRDDLNILYSRADIQIGKKRMNYIQLDVTNILINAIENMKLTNSMKAEIRSTLHEIGNLTKYQAKYFTKILLKDFRSAFCKDYENNENKKEIDSETCREKYNVFYNTTANKVIANNFANSLTESTVEINSKTYAQKVENEIEKWLTEIEFKVQFAPGSCIRKIAISDLAEDIVERKKYLQLNPKSKSSKGELNHLKFQIYKWLGKLIGNLNLVDYAAALNVKLECLKEPDLVSDGFNKSADFQYTFLDKECPSSKNKEHEKLRDEKLNRPNTNYLDRISEAVFDWVQELPDEVLTKKIRYHHLRSLAENIERGLDNSKLLDPIFDDEINFWTTNVLGCQLNNRIKENLKDRIETLIYLEDMYDLIPKGEEDDECSALSDVSLQVKTMTCNRANNTDLNEELLLPSTDRNCKDIEEIVNQINAWLQQLNLRAVDENPFKNVAINDLAGDIYDRKKYLEVNPINCSEVDELNHLKYQIFKWFNKLLSNEINVMVDHAEILMEKLNGRIVDNHSMFSREALYGDASIYRDSGFVLKDLDDDEINQEVCTSTRDLFTPGTSKDVKASLISKILSDTFDKGLNIEEEELINDHFYVDKYVETEEVDIPEGLSTKQVYEHYDKYFKKWCRELPVRGTSHEIESLGNVAKRGIYNGIWKSFFKYKSEIDIGNDYELFVSMFEDRLDVLLDYLPQTEFLKHYRNKWKKKIVFAVTGMVKYVFNVKDSNIKQDLIKKFNNEFLKPHLSGTADGLQQSFVAEVINAFILYLRFKNKGEESSYYRQRLMSKLEDLSNHVKTQHKNEFRFVSQAVLSQEAFKILMHLPQLNIETLCIEADDILLTEVIESWKAELANKDIEIEGNEAGEALAKKIRSILKQRDREKVRTELKREIAKFLKDMGDVDEDIELMVRQLVTRLEDKGLLELEIEPRPVIYKISEVVLEL